MNAPDAAMQTAEEMTLIQRKKTVLNVGCGHRGAQQLPPMFQGNGWQEIRLDINPATQPDILASMTDMSEVADATVDAVYSSHTLEHLHRHEVDQALREFHRVLKPGEVAIITLPDLQRIAELIAADQLDETAYTSPAGPITALDMIYGHQQSIARGETHMMHKTGFTSSTLGQALVRAGFTKVRVKREGFHLWAFGYKARLQCDCTAIGVAVEDRFDCGTDLLDTHTHAK